MIANVNFRGQILDSVDELPFRKQPPHMYSQRYSVDGGPSKITLIIFPSGKCRVMGCRDHISKYQTSLLDKLPYRFGEWKIMSTSVTFDMQSTLNLQKLGNYCYQSNVKYIFEPELFPALRLTTYNPLCVNVFSSGKCVVLGIRHLCYAKVIHKIRRLINTSDCLQQ